MLLQNATLNQDMRAIDETIEREFPLEKSSKAVSFDVGGVTCRIKLNNEDMHKSLTQRYGNFACPESDAEPDIEIEVCEVEAFNFDKYPSIKVEYHEGSYYGFRWDFYCRLTVGEKIKGYIILPVGGTFLSIDAFVRISYSVVTVLNDGFLVHGAGILSNGQGFLFPGKSGSGKSTLSRNSISSKTILTDEISMVIKSKDNGHYYLHGTPFWGDMQHGENIKVDLSGIMFLVQDKQVRLKEIPTQKKQIKLLSNILFFAKDKDLTTKVFETAGIIADKVPIFNLHLLPDDSCWRCIHDYFK